MELRLLIVLVVGFAIGIAAGTTLVVPAQVIVLLLVLSVAVGMVRRKNSTGVFSPHLLLLGGILAAVALGLWRTDLATLEESQLADSVGEQVALTGVVRREPDVREQQQMLYIKSGDELLLVSTDRHVDVAYGDEVKLAGTLKVPASFTTELGREFDYPGYLRARGVQYRISFAEVEVLVSGRGNVIVSALVQTKHHFMTALERVLPEPYVGLGEGLLLGEKRALGQDISDQFRRTGLTHIVVLSGYNVMLVVAFCLYVFSFFFGLRGRVIAGVLAITAFAILVGPSATVVRASVMAVMVLVAQATGRRYDVLRALLLAGTIMLVLNPYLLLYDIGFQLSFMATLGLVLFVPRFESTVAHKCLVTLREFFMATLVTQIAVFPLLVYHIGEVSLIAVLANVLVLPIVPVAMLATFVVGMIALVSVTAAQLVSFLPQLSLAYILTITDILAHVPFATVAFPAVSPVVVVLLYAALAVAYWWWKLPRMRNEFADWVIIEEKELEQEGKKSPLTTPAEKDSEPPIFFR